MIAPEATETVRRLALEGRLELLERTYAVGDLAGQALIFVATDDRRVSEAVAEEAEEEEASAVDTEVVVDHTRVDLTLPRLEEGHRGMEVVDGGKPLMLDKNLPNCLVHLFNIFVHLFAHCIYFGTVSF